jgi:hypothetical protein
MERMMYNTVLGARPMHTDGRAFYYADYNYAGKKVYSDHLFPCCSGTLPQVATDYGINSYFHDERGIFVNLYLPSSVRWKQDGWSMTLSQAGDYPFEDSVHFELQTSAPKDFTINLRIPEWANGARIEINGKRRPESVVPGAFAAISRQWSTGDRIDLELPRKLRLEPVDSNHLNTVALLCGPLVLFPIRERDSHLSFVRSELLAAKQTRPQLWKTGPRKFVPYVAIDEEQYSTYVEVSV